MIGFIETRPCVKNGCGKLRSDTSDYCPHHQMLIDEEPADRSRRAKRSAARREGKKELSKLLETSPLRGYNALFRG